MSPRIVAGTLFAALIVVLAAAAAWPIYRSISYLVLVAVSVLVAAIIAGLSRRFRWSGWLVAAALVGTVAVVGVPLAVPTRLGGVGEFFRGLAEVASGVLLAWKDLVTVQLPVGSYRNLLVPALIVFLVGTCLLLRLAWRGDKVAYLAVPLGIAMTAFGLFFGRTTVSAPLQLGPVTLYAPVETALGVGTLVVALGWLAWRAADERARALQRAAVSSGVRVSRRPSRADRHRTALGAAMVVTAVVVGAAVVPFAAQGADREVLRSAIGPDIDLAAAESPLSQYRALFTDQSDRVMFTVASAGTMPSRVRVATLDSYDGEVFRSGGDGSAESGRFVRVPSTLDAGDGVEVEAEITIGALSGVWMPTIGALESVTFSGSRGTALADRFYYSQTASSGVQTAGGGLTEGDTYVVAGVEPATPALAEIAPRGVTAADEVPDNLREWVKRHAQGSGGAALESLVDLLRERGYLSHGLAVTADEQPEWAQALGDYVVQPSASGHSLARVDALFQRLLERERDPRAESSENYVAAIGDDEQFAVAVALIARELGFPSRVVLGARMDAETPGLATCEAGVCEAHDLTVWTEVSSESGEWVPIDVTPQYAESPSLDVTELQDPKNVTEVRPDAAEQVRPPDPLQQDSAVPDQNDDEQALDVAWLWPVLRIAAIVLLLLALAFGPFLLIIAAKAARRRGRRNAPTTAERVSGAWDEYVDAAVDAGRGAPAVLTRSELAERFATPAGAELAEAADRAVFSGAAVTDAEVSQAWTTLGDERRALRDEASVWSRLVATVSLRSFIRQLAPGRSARSRVVEKGRRAPVARSAL